MAVKAHTGRIVAYYRHGYEDMLDAEMSALQENFVVTDNLDDLRRGDRVLCRFSLMPFAGMLQAQVQAAGATLIHDVAAHDFIADMRCWYSLLSGSTPATWFDIEDVTGDGPFFVKGITNSIKSTWSSCYASDRADLNRVLNEQSQHALMASQPYAIRQYEELMTYGVNVETGAPITEEYRFFMCDEKVLSGGFYWNEQMGVVEQACEKSGMDLPDVSRVPKSMLDKAAKAIAPYACYYVLDVGRKVDGSFIFIEVNDATMSGLSANDPHKLYGNLKAAL